jgi:hypothetical protein
MLQILWYFLITDLILPTRATFWSPTLWPPAIIGLWLEWRDGVRGLWDKVLVTCARAPPTTSVVSMMVRPVEVAAAFIFEGWAGWFWPKTLTCMCVPGHVCVLPGKTLTLGHDSTGAATRPGTGTRTLAESTPSPMGLP